MFCISNESEKFRFASLKGDESRFIQEKMTKDPGNLFVVHTAISHQLDSVGLKKAVRSDWFKMGPCNTEYLVLQKTYQEEEDNTKPNMSKRKHLLFKEHYDQIINMNPHLTPDQIMEVIAKATATPLTKVKSSFDEHESSLGSKSENAFNVIFYYACMSHKYVFDVTDNFKIRGKELNGPTLIRVQ